MPSERINADTYIAFKDDLGDLINRYLAKSPAINARHLVETLDVYARELEFEIELEEVLERKIAQNLRERGRLT